MKVAFVLLICVMIIPSTPAQVIRPLTDSKRVDYFVPAVTADGSATFFYSSGDPTGDNSNRHAQLFRLDLVTGVATQVTNLPLGIPTYKSSINRPAINSDGSRIAFISSEDLVGQNADRSEEIYMMDTDGSNLAQVTDGNGDGSIGVMDMTPDASRLVFDASLDYLGSNPGLESRAWVVDADGSGLIQVSGGSGWLPSISDDGQRVVYTNLPIPRVVAVAADGSNLHDLTTWPSFAFDISGDGLTAIFQHTDTLPMVLPGGCGDGESQIGAIDWDGNNPVRLSAPCLGAAFPGTASHGALGFDGQSIYYAARDISFPVMKVNRSGTIQTPLVTLPDPDFADRCQRIGVAADGSRVVVACPVKWTLTNRLGNRRLYSAEGDGSGWQQLTFDKPVGDNTNPVIARDSGVVVFVSDFNLLDETPDPGRQLYRVNADGNGLERITALHPSSSFHAATTTDGSITVFNSLDASLTTELLFTVTSPDNVVTSITPPTLNFDAPSIAGDGSRIVANIKSTIGAIYSMGPDGSGLTNLDMFGVRPRLDGSGATMTFAHLVSGINQWEIWLHEFAGGTTQILAQGISPDISQDGQLVAFQSDANPLGFNFDNNYEIFIINSDGTQLRQATVSTGNDNIKPVLSGDGKFVYYANDTRLMRYNVLTQRIEWIGGPQCSFSAETDDKPLEVNQDGSLVVFSGGKDCSNENLDGSLEIFIVDGDQPPVLRFGPDLPSALRWDTVSTAQHYDIIRGSVANLLPGGDLGVVVCIENNSTDATTLGFPDPADPAPGEIFFYLVRGIPGWDYGFGSSGSPRNPTSGDCNTN